MTWTAKVATVEKQPENPINIKVTAEFASATGEIIQRVTFGNNITDEWIAAWVKANIDSLDERDVALPEITKGPVTPAALPVTEQQQFAVALQDLARLDQRARLGIVSVDDAEYKNAAALAKSLYQPGF